MRKPRHCGYDRVTATRRRRRRRRKTKSVEGGGKIDNCSYTSFGSTDDLKRFVFILESRCMLSSLSLCNTHTHLYVYIYRGFKALKQTVKTLFKIGRYSELLESYKLMLTYTKTAVTRNYSEKSLSKLLDVVSSSSDIEFLMSFYETTLEGLTDSKNERLWFKTNLKLCTLWQENKDFLKLGKKQRP